MVYIYFSFQRKQSKDYPYRSLLMNATTVRLIFFKFISHFMRILNTLFFLIEITVDFYINVVFFSLYFFYFKQMTVFKI